MKTPVKKTFGSWDRAFELERQESLKSSWCSRDQSSDTTFANVDHKLIIIVVSYRCYFRFTLGRFSIECCQNKTKPILITY